MSIKSKFINAALVVVCLTALLCWKEAQAQAQAQAQSDNELNQIELDSPQETEIPTGENSIDVIDLPEESVFPKTDTKNSVINKKVSFRNQFAVEALAGIFLDEPLLNSNYWSVKIGYFKTEELYFGGGFKSRIGGMTSYGQQIKNLNPPILLDEVPAPTQSQFISVGYNFFYGKLSLTQDSVITTSAKLDGDFGMQQNGNSYKPFIQSSVTQSFYLNKNVAIGFNIGLSLAQVYDYTSVYLRSSSAPSESGYPTKLQFNQYIGGSVIFLISN
jgi:hypothetical protein